MTRRAAHRRQLLARLHRFKKQQAEELLQSVYTVGNNYDDWLAVVYKFRRLRLEVLEQIRDLS